MGAMTILKQAWISAHLPLQIVILVNLSPHHGQAFPPEVFNPRYQFIMAGDINLGAILSVHKPKSDDAHARDSRGSSKEREQRRKQQEDRGSNPKGMPKRGTTRFNDSNESRDKGDNPYSRFNAGHHGKTSHGRSKNGVKSAGALVKRPNMTIDSSPRDDGLQLFPHKNVEDAPNSSGPVTPSAFNSNETATNATSKSVLHSLLHDSKTPDVYTGVRSQNDKINTEKYSKTGDPIMDKSKTQGPKTLDSSPSLHPRSRQTRTKNLQGESSICSDLIANFQALENVVAIMFALEKINNSTDLLPNTTLGVTILDDCFLESLALARALQFMPAASRHFHTKQPKEHFIDPSQGHETLTSANSKPEKSTGEKKKKKNRRASPVHGPVRFDDTGDQYDDVTESGKVESDHNTGVRCSRQSRSTKSDLKAVPSLSMRPNTDLNSINKRFEINPSIPSLGDVISKRKANKGTTEISGPKKSVLVKDVPNIGQKGNLNNNQMTKTDGRDRQEEDDLGIKADNSEFGGQFGMHLGIKSDKITDIIEGLTGHENETVSRSHSDIKKGTKRDTKETLTLPKRFRRLAIGPDKPRGLTTPCRSKHGAKSAGLSVRQKTPLQSDNPGLKSSAVWSISSSSSSSSSSISLSSSSLSRIQNESDGICARELPSRDEHFSEHRRTVTDHLPPFFDVIGVIGAYTSSLSVVVADVMTLFNLPQISHASTTDILSDKSKYPGFFRTLPADRYQVRALADLLEHFNWTYVSIVFSADAYGTQAEKSLRTLLRGKDICVAQTAELSDNMGFSDYDDVIFQLRASQNARVVALYADIKHIRPLMLALKRQRAFHEFIWAGSDTMSLVADMEENCKYLLGSLSVSMYSAPPPEFTDYLQSFVLQHRSTLRSAVTGKEDDKVYTLFEDISSLKGFDPSLNDTSWNNLHSYTPTFTVTYAIDAVYAYAYAIQNFIEKYCPGATGSEAKKCLQRRSLLPSLKTVSFPGVSGNVCFNEKGDVVGKIAINQCQIHDGVAKQVSVAKWDLKSLTFDFDHLQWPNKTNAVPKSLCAAPCGSHEVYTFPKQTCCWKCVRCQPNSRTVENRTKCVECPMFHWPDDVTGKKCYKIEPVFINLHDLVPLVLAIVATLGLMTSVLTAFTFYTYRKERIIRSSSRELSTLMMTGIILAFLLQYSLLSPPTTLTCYCNQVGFSLTFTLVYGPLFVKTNRIYRIFTAGRKSAALPKWTSSASQLFFASCFILVQVVIVTLSTTLAPPYVTDLMPLKSVKYVIRYCDMPLAGYLPALAFNFLLVLVCTWYAFKTRRLPDNYNESRYIAFCVDTTVLVWISFIPTYFAMNRPYFKAVILAVALLINSIVCLLCLFVPKMYALYMSKQNSPDGRGCNDLGGCGSGGDIHIQMVSNLSMAGLIRSTPSMMDSSVSKDQNSSLDFEKGGGASRPTSSGVYSDSCNNDHHGQAIRLLSATDALINRMSSEIEASASSSEQSEVIA